MGTITLLPPRAHAPAAAQKPAEPTKPSTIYVSPRDFAEWIAPCLRHNPPLRARILREIMKQPNAMIRVLLNPDWDTCVGGIPTKFYLEEVTSISRSLYCELIAHGRLPDNAYADRSVWRSVLLKAAL